VVEDGKRQPVTKGTPQGAVISPPPSRGRLLLANIYLHYVYDLWAGQWRRRHAHGAMIVVRYADDTSLALSIELMPNGFWRTCASGWRNSTWSRSRQDPADRIRRRCRGDRAARGDGKPETFNFLGFTHIRSRSRRGGFLLSRHTRRDRKRAKLLEITEDLRRRWHQSIAEQGQWLGSVVRGFFACHAVPTNIRALSAFRTMSSDSGGAPCAGAARGTGRHGQTWTAGESLAAQTPDIHPWPSVRFRVKHPRWSRMREFRAYGSVRGRPVMGVPTAT